MTFTFFLSIGSHCSTGFTFSLETSFDSFPLLFLVLGKGGGVSSAFFDINVVKDDPDVAVLDMLTNGIIVGVALSRIFVSPDVSVLDARLSVCNPLLPAPDAGSFFSAFDFRNAVRGEDDSVFSGLLALLSCLLRHDDPVVGFKSSTEK